MSPQSTAAALLPVSGPLNIGYLLNWGLFGVISVQVYLYYLAFPNDKPFIKHLVYGIFCMEFIQSIVISRDSFVTFASGFGDPDAITNVHLLWLTMSLIVIVACVVQLFYAFRIRVLSKSKVLPLIIVTLALTQCGAGLSASIIIHKLGNFNNMESTALFIAQGFRDGATVLCDMTIALSMWVSLTRNTDTRNDVCVKSTEARLTRMLRLSVVTGSLTAFFAALDLSLYFSLQKSGGYFIVPCVSIGKLYSNSMMVMLNSRIQIIGGRNTSDTTMVDMDVSLETQGSSVNVPLKTWNNEESYAAASSKLYRGVPEQKIEVSLQTEIVKK